MRSDSLPSARGRAMRDVNLAVPGRLTSIQACELFVLRRESPSRWTAETLAARFNVKVDDVRLILRHTVLPATAHDASGTLGYWQVRASLNPVLASHKCTERRLAKVTKVQKS